MCPTIGGHLCSKGINLQGAFAIINMMPLIVTAPADLAYLILSNLFGLQTALSSKTPDEGHRAF
jgi:hypothetical protein